MNGLWQRMGHRLCVEAPSPRLVVAAVLLVHGLVALAMGLRRGADTITYSRMADALIAHRFDAVTALAQWDTTYPGLLYALFVTLIAVLKLALGDHWHAGLAVLNLLAAASVAALLVRLAFRGTGSAAASWAALALFLGCFGIAKWIPYALSDTSFLLLSFGIFALAADRILAGRGSWIPIFALVVVAVLYRPTGIVLLATTAWACFLARTEPGIVRKGATALLAAIIVPGVFLFAGLMKDPSRWPFETLRSAIESTALRYGIGEVVWDRPLTYHAAPESLLDHVAISGDRFLHFFAITAEDYSLFHKIVEALFFVPTYALALVLLVALARGADGLTGPQRTLMLAAGATVLITALFHGLLQVDFDWRYRLPVLPQMILLAAGGVAVLRRRRTGSRGPLTQERRPATP